jgi:hypothetical protein
MTSNPESTVQQLQQEFQNLLTYVSGPDARSPMVYAVERTLFQRLLALGTALWRLFLVTRAAGHLGGKSGRHASAGTAGCAVRGGPASTGAALTHGAEAVQQQVMHHLPAHTLVLDCIHPTETLWDTANVLVGETHSRRMTWVCAYLQPLLAGQTDAVITALEAEAKNPSCTRRQRQARRRTVGYYRRNQPYMRYDPNLARGRPIGTGVVEGARGHLVKDCMEQSGMRWSQEGAQGVLDLRAVRLNGHCDVYLQFHWQQHR